MLNFAKQTAAGMLLLALGTGVVAAQAVGPPVPSALPELQPCSPQAASRWQNNAFQKAVASSQSIQSTHGAIAGEGAGDGIDNTYQQTAADIEEDRGDDFEEPEDGAPADSCWSKVGDRLGAEITSVFDGIAEAFAGLFDWDIPDIEDMADLKLGDVLCKATLRVESVLAGGIHVAARLPRILSDNMIRNVRCGLGDMKTMSTGRYADWHGCPSAIPAGKFATWCIRAICRFRAHGGSQHDVAVDLGSVGGRIDERQSSRLCNRGVGVRAGVRADGARPGDRLSRF